MQLTFHLGTFKTGTTTLQHVLDNNRRLLKSSGILYPRTGRKHKRSVHTRHIALSHQKDGSPRQQRIFKQLFEEIDRSGCDQVLLSTETWSNPRNFNRLTRLVGECRSRKMDTHGLILFRNRFDYARSHYREWTQNWSNTDDFPSYVAARAVDWDYHATAKRMNDLFEGNVTFLCYEDRANSVEAVSEQLNLPVLSQSAPQNPSLTALENEVCRQLNLSGVKKRDTLPSLEAIFGDCPFWTSRLNFSEAVDQPALHAPQPYQQDFAYETGFTPAQIDRIFSCPINDKRDIADISAPITDALQRALNTPAPT